VKKKRFTEIIAWIRMKFLISFVLFLHRRLYAFVKRLLVQFLRDWNAQHNRIALIIYEDPRYIDNSLWNSHFACYTLQHSSTIVFKKKEKPSSESLQPCFVFYLKVSEFVWFKYGLIWNLSLVLFVQDNSSWKK